MDFFRINRTDYFPDQMIQGYSSLIWTERYEAPGDFKLVTPRIDETMALLTEMSLVTLRDTREVMMVEDLEIKPGSNGTMELTVTGRSVDAFAEQRYLESPYNKKYRMAGTYTVAQAATVMLWNAFVNPSEQDVTHPIDWFRFSTDSLPNVVVTDSTNVSIPSSRRWLNAGQMNVELIRYLHYRRLGIRGVRPKPNAPAAKIVTVGTGGNGTISYQTAQTDSLRFDVYNGTDRSIEQSANTPVIFRHDTGDVEDPSYLFSVRNRKTVATIASSVYSQGGAKIFDETLNGDEGSSTTGWNRRALWLDGGTPDQGDVIGEEWFLDLREEGKGNLRKYQLTRAFDGKISPVSRNNYGVDFFLGDTVTLLGEYGIKQPMRVAQYTRSVDEQEGYTSYPGLEVPD